MNRDTLPAGPGRHRDPAKEQFWRQTLRQFARGRQSVRVFCRTHRLSEACFYAWRRILRQRRPAPPTFLPVVVSDPPQDSAACITIELRGGRMMRLPADLDRQRLSQILWAIEGAA